ncbi:MAG: hypothetical protein IT349_11525 [Candidatus Eisenbacteria bacterium]|nr:hypothetical protein [Candidatus Eisenbacteria bacterium]
MSGAKNRKRRGVGVIGTPLLLGGLIAGLAAGTTRPGSASGEPTASAVAGELSSMLPSAQERLLEQIQTEKLGFRRAVLSPSREGAGNGLASSLAGDAAAAGAGAPDLSLSSIDFWLGGTVPRWILLSGLLLGLSFLTASLALYLRGRRSKARARSAAGDADVAPKISAVSESAQTDPRVVAARVEAARADLERRAAVAREAVVPAARPMGDGVDLPPRRFARYATLDEDRAYAATSGSANAAPTPVSQPAPPRPSMPAPMYQEAPFDPPLPAPVRQRSTEKKPKRTKLDRRISLLEGSMLQILSSVDRLASRVETLADPVVDEREENLTLADPEPIELGPWQDPLLALPPSNRSVHPEPFFARLAAQRAQTRPDAGSVGESAPREALTPSALPAAERAETQPSGPRPVAPRASAPRPRPEPPTAAQGPITPIRMTKPAALPRPVPVVPPPAVRAPDAPMAAMAPVARSAGRLPDPARVREFVLRLARDGWSADRIARETKIPSRDIALILKSAGRQTGSAETAGIRR